MKTQSLSLINFKAQNHENKKATAPLSKALALAFLTGMSASCTNNSYINHDIFEKAQTEMFSDDTVNTQIPYLLTSTFLNIKDFKIDKHNDYNYTISMKDDEGLKARVTLQAEKTDKSAARGIMKVNGAADYDFKLKFDKNKKEMCVQLKEKFSNKTDSFFVKRYDDALKIYNSKHKQIFIMPLDDEENEIKNKTVQWDLSIICILFALFLLGAYVNRLDI